MKLDAKNNESIRDFENWVKGELYGPHKEAKETQPMSDTLQEREDQMVSANYCDHCNGRPHAPWCPNYKQVEQGRSPNDECAFIHRLVSGNVRCGALREHHSQYTGHKFTEPRPTSSAHEPAVRGGGERIRVELVNGVEGQCVSVNDYRICGPKPYGGGSIAKSWTTDKNDILRAFLTPDQKHAWLADELEVVSVNQHQALVAERDRLLAILRDVRKWLNTPKQHRSSTLEILRMVESAEQRSTSE